MFMNYTARPTGCVDVKCVGFMYCGPTCGALCEVMLAHAMTLVCMFRPV